MNTSNYLINFLQDIDTLISEINRLESKIRLYQRNSNIFDIDFDCHFSISSEYFVKLREVIQQKIEQGSNYDKQIVDLKREFSRDYKSILIGISKEIARIDLVQEKEMNRIVYKAIFNAKVSNEIEIRDSYNVKSSIFDNFLGIAKFRELSYQQHDLRIRKIEKDYKNQKQERRSIFELASLIENTDTKSGELLCLQDDIIKYFMIDRNTIKRSATRNWKSVTLIPKGIFNIRNYYKILNQNIKLENLELEREIEDRREEFILKQDSALERLERINAKLSKIIKGSLRIESRE